MWAICISITWVFISWGFRSVHQQYVLRGTESILNRTNVKIVFVPFLDQISAMSRSDQMCCPCPGLGVVATYVMKHKWAMLVRSNDLPDLSLSPNVFNNTTHSIISRSRTRPSKHNDDRLHGVQMNAIFFVKCDPIPLWVYGSVINGQLVYMLAIVMSPG